MVLKPSITDQTLVSIFLLFKLMWKLVLSGKVWLEKALPSYLFLKLKNSHFFGGKSRCFPLIILALNDFDSIDNVKGV